MSQVMNGKALSPYFSLNNIKPETTRNKIKYSFLFLTCLLLTTTAFSQVGIGTATPHASAVLDVESTTKGFLPPRMDNAQRDAIGSPTEGLTIYNSEFNSIQFFDGNLWFDISEGGLTPGALSDCPTTVPFLPADETIIKEVTNPVTGKTWMDRNLGAYTADRSIPGPSGGTDCWAYGSLFQWGRAADGHENRSSSTNAGPLADGSEGSDFITVGSSPFDWLATSNSDRWNANETAGGTVVKTANDPCPDGYRVPTDPEWVAEQSSWPNPPISSAANRNGAINTPLKLPVAGGRNFSSGVLFNVGNAGQYWSSSTFIGKARSLYFDINDAIFFLHERALGFSVRCIKD